MNTDRSAPTFYVKIYPEGQQGERADVTTRVLSFTYDEGEGQADKAEILVDNFDLSLLDDPLWRKGNFLELAWGYAGNLSAPRAVVIQRIKGNSRQLTIEAHAQSILMNKKPRSRVFENMTRADVVRQIARENGYGVDVQSIDDTAITFPSISQTNLTDAAFVKNLATKEGFQFSADSAGFHFHRRKLGAAPIKTYVWYIDPGIGELLDWSIDNDITTKPGAVTAKGVDPLKKKVIDQRADNASTQRDGLGDIIEIVDAPTGATSDQKNTAAEATLLTTAQSAEAAKREADGRLIEALHTSVHLSLQCIGDPRVTAKQVIEVQNISRRLSGRYYITKVKHKLGQGYRMDVTCRTDGTAGIAGTKNARNDANVNTKDPADPNALVPKEVTSVTGETQLQYVPASSVAP